MEKVIKLLMQVTFIEKGSCDDIENIYDTVNNMLKDIVNDSI